MGASQEAIILIHRHGAELVDNSTSTELDASVYAPEGAVWVASDCHTISVHYHSDKPAGWRALRDDLKKGTRPCDDPDCEVCG